MSQWRVSVRHDGPGTQLRLSHPSGLCRGWSGDLACRLCRNLGLDSGEYPCPKAQAWQLFLLAHALEAQAAPSPPLAITDDETCRRAVQAHGLRPTPARTTIAARLLGTARHVTAEQLRLELDQAGHRYSRTTIRKVLDEFVAWDLLQQIDVGGGTVFYDTVTSPHAHIYNVDSGELLDLAPDQAWITGLPELPGGMRLDAVQLVFRVRDCRSSGTGL